MSQKKVLIITYYWPPAGGPGVQRWLKFVKYLPENGIEPIVFIPENPSYPLLDETLAKEVDKNLKIVRCPIKEPYAKAKLVSKEQTNQVSKGIINKQEKQSFAEKLLLFVRGNFFIPDARKGWIKPATIKASELIKQLDIKTVVTTGPPHSLHLIGMNLQQSLGVKWIADFRDPWTTIGYHKKLKLLPFAKKKHKQLEHAVLNNADHIVVTSYTTQNEFEALTQKPITVVTNGFDTENVPEQTLNTKFSLAHIGSLLSERNPEVLWQVLSELVYENRIFKSQLELTLVGAVSNEVLTSLEKHDLTQFVDLVGYVSHEEALKYQRKAQLLLLIEIDSEETRSIIPGKLFEYIAAKRPIVALGPEGSDVQHVLRETEAGQYFTYNDKETLKAELVEYFDAYNAGKLSSNAKNLAQYSRSELTKKMASIILDS